MFPSLFFIKVPNRLFPATLICLGALFLAAHANLALAATVRYARPGGLASGSCDSWGAACNLPTALAAAVGGDQIWVAQGVYTPTARLDPADPRSATYSLKSGVAIFGGFAGTEAMLAERDIAAFPTILSGDLAGNDLTGGTNAENAYHVVVGSGTDGTAVLDGFTISGGNANGAALDKFGGGIYNSSGSPMVTNVTISGNWARDSGGGIYNSSGSPLLTNVTISGNTATGLGGGMYDGSGSPLLTNVTISGNTGTSAGGGLFTIFSSPKLINVTIFANEAFSTNSGGMYSDTSTPRLTNVIIASNTGGDCTSAGGVLDADHTLIADGTNTCGLSSGTNGNIIGQAPNLGPLADNGGPTRTHALPAVSPAIDKGSPSGCPIADQRGVARPQGAGCDIGAFERYTGVFYVKPAATGNCTAWVAACNLQAALSAAFSGDQIWVAAGIHKPHVSDRAVSFVLKTGVKVYGGFAGTENRLEQRDIAAYPTILSGDLAGNDLTGGTNADNAYHVVVVPGAWNNIISAELDGFIISGGNANGPYPGYRGGGIYNFYGNLTLKNVTISNNAANQGGGMFSEGPVSPTLTNVTFFNNTAGAGGGMDNLNGSSPTLTNVIFNSNSATNGGGMYNYTINSKPTLTNVTFSGNIATDSGGGMYNNSCSPTLTGVSFSGNIATGSGGGMYNKYSAPTLTGATFSSNEATVNGGGMVNFGSGPSLENVAFTGNEAGEDGGGIYNEDQSNPTLINVTFTTNTARFGGGMYNNVRSSSTLIDVTFASNEAGYGGGMYNNVESSPALKKVTFSSNTAATNGGGMVNSGGSAPLLTNVTFSTNEATTGGGGGMYNSSSSPLLTNVTFSGNAAGFNNGGGGMFNVASSRPTLTNVIIANSTRGGDCVNQSTTLNAASSHNLIEDSAAACGLNNNNGNIIGRDPRLGPLAGSGGTTQTHPLRPDSPAVNAGKASACPATDQRGVARPQGGSCDIGAFEIVFLYLPLVRHDN